MSIDISSMTKEEIQESLDNAVFNMLSTDDRIALSERLNEIESNIDS